MIGKSLMEYRFGPVARFARWVGWESPTFAPRDRQARHHDDRRLDVHPVHVIMLLAGLQALRGIMEQPASTAPTPGRRSGRSSSR